MTEPSKRCSICQHIKPLSAFGVARRNPDGRRSECRECANEAARAARQRNRTETTHTCSCGAAIYHAPRKGAWPARCEKCRRVHELEQEADYRQRHQDQLRKGGRERAAAVRAADPEAARQKQRDYWQKIKNQVLDHYGHKCACCAAATHLSIDHISGDGAEHREELYGNARHGSGWRFYMWLINNSFPPGYQTLCRSCNRSKGNGPRCQLDHTR